MLKAAVFLFYFAYLDDYMSIISKTEVVYGAWYKS